MTRGGNSLVSTHHVEMEEPRDWGTNFLVGFCGEGVGERFVKAELAEAGENFLRSTLISVRRMYGHFGDFGNRPQEMCRHLIGGAVAGKNGCVLVEGLL